MSSIDTKYLIIGAGPAGLQMGYFLQKAGMDYLILEKSAAAGSFFAKHPVHRKLISINKKFNYFEEDEFNLRHDWNSLLSDAPQLRFTEYTDILYPPADILFRYMQDFAAHFSLKIKFNTSVSSIQKQGDVFVVETSGGEEYRCKVLLMGLGAMAANMPKEIEGIELTTPYSAQSLDLDLYKNKRIGILGGGNSAFETAEYFSAVAAHVHILSRSPIKMAWDTHFVGHVRAIHNNIFDMYQLKSLHAVLSPRILKIEKLEDGTLMTTHEYDYPDSNPPGTLRLNRVYDFIINCTGWVWGNTDLFAPEIKPATRMNGKFLQLNPDWQSANIENLYYIGGAMQSRDRKAASGFIHGFRYNIRTLSHLLMEKYEGKAFPYTDFTPFDGNVFLDKMYKRVSTADGLYQMYGVLADQLVLNGSGTAARYYKEVPLAHAQDHLNPEEHNLLITLEFGFHHHPGRNSLEFMGPSDPNDTPKAAFLHPVIRHYYQGVSSEFHFGDSLLGRWDRPHQEGGAVASYHNDFLEWLQKKTGLSFPQPERKHAADGPYRVWTAEELEAYKSAEMAKSLMM
jgi:thioredoxin reductase